MENQTYALVKTLKKFRVYVFHSHIIAYVLANAIKDILTQTNPKGRRPKWITSLIKYDLQIYPTKLIKRQGLAKVVAQSNCEVLGVNFLEFLSYNLVQDEVNQVHQDFYASPWYTNILYVLKNLQDPLELTTT